MKKKKELAAKKVASILEAYLSVEANSSSCLVMYQPKAPEELARYKKTK